MMVKIKKEDVPDFVWFRKTKCITSYEHIMVLVYALPLIKYETFLGLMVSLYEIKEL